jgi:phosphoglycolate phosphatase-like HAD superfamily hydrolase
LIKESDDEYIIIQNPNFVHPEFDIVPLAQKQKKLFGNCAAVVMDMDGTTATTEQICLHSLEYMLRKITNRTNKRDWEGFDQNKDYPYIIGNSTTKHVEYLVKTYQKFINQSALIQAFIFASLWTINIGNDKARRLEAIHTLKNFLGSNEFNNVKISQLGKVTELKNISIALADKYFSSFNFSSSNNIVRAAIEVYYQRYHEILTQISKGNCRKLAKDILHDSNKNLIAPLPGVGIFLALIKGLLGNEASKLAAQLHKQYHQKHIKSKNKIDGKIIAKRLEDLGKKFEKHPAKIVVVTSSIQYEADIVMEEVFRILKEETASWEISPARKRNINEAFSSYKSFYDGFVTASDSNEIRLKPHRDLYSIALHELSIDKKDFNRVIGLEDSESGITAMRAAGIGLCIALPFAQSLGHNFDMASFVVKGGLPELIIKHRCFV